MLFRSLLHLSLLFLFSLLSINGAGQNCNNPTSANGDYLHANNVRAFYMASGGSFFDGDDAQYGIYDPLDELSSIRPVSSIFAHGLWMGGYDADSDLSVAVATYGLSNGNHDYYPGPLMEDGSVVNSVCSNFDRVWSVYRYQIEAHQADFADNGVIDNPIAAVVGWPAWGNDQFEAINGFELPDNPQGFAEFEDLNANGRYDPLQGEYPRIDQASITPDQIIWTVFNTRGNAANESGSEPQLSIEVQLTAWAIMCTDNPTVNNTTFASYKIISRELEPINEFRVALWSDFDLGCFTDDYVGSEPLLNTYFVYNQDNYDDLTCTGLGFPGTEENPPVQAISFLNQSLDYFNYYSNGGGSPTPPPGTTDPATPVEYYNLMDGLFRDGTPITTGGTGYNPGSTDIVNHAFPGDPNNVDEWSEVSADLPAADRRSIGSTRIPVLNPGQVYTLDVAYSYHRVEGSDHLENVTNMYAGVTSLQSVYDNNFLDVCSQQMICEEDCIWSGDLNADGIANHEDLFANNFYSAANEPERDGPYNWSPQSGTNWSGVQLNGQNTKHLDANGDGVLTMNDFDKTIQHYNRTRPDYVPVFDYPVGDDITFNRLGNGGSTDNLSAGEFFFAQVRLETDIPDLRSLAFSMEYDPQYYQQMFGSIVVSELPFPNILYQESPNSIDFAVYEGNTEEYLEPSAMVLLQVRIADDFTAPFPPAETTIRFRNIRAYLSDGTEVELGARDAVLNISDLVSTEEPSWAQSIQLYPNPVKDQLQLQSDNITIDQLQVFDSNGRAVFELLQNTNDLDTKQLPAGIYYLRIFSEGQFVVRKFVKM